VTDDLVTYNLAGRYLLADLWADVVLDPVWDVVGRIQDRGLTLILAHPERLRAVQDSLDVAWRFRDLGVLLQGNLQCFGDPTHTHTRQTADRLLEHDAYFMLGSDTHRADSMEGRLRGLRNLAASLDPGHLDRLTIHNPKTLLGI